MNEKHNSKEELLRAEIEALERLNRIVDEHRSWSKLTEEWHLHWGMQVAAIRRQRQ